MNILLIGNGAREHAIAQTLMKSSHQPSLFSYMKANNPGITALSEGVELGNYDDLENISGFADQINPDFAFIGPEDPLSHGVVDMLEEKGIPCIGPRKDLAQLETSKGFTRDLLKKYDIAGNPQFQSFTADTIDEASVFVDGMDSFVVKADGLAGGKGVLVQGDHFDSKEEGLAHAKDFLQKHPSVLIEEKLEGEEFSFQCLTDGKTVVGTPVAQDHKRAHEGDKGPNTGGMGSYTFPDHLLPFLKQEHIDQALDITKHVAEALEKEFGHAYRGVMYGGFMLTKNGVKLIEYNARFGDPEAMNVLVLLKTDFVDVCRAMIDQKLGDLSLEFENKATVCKYIVPEGYPENPVKGEQITYSEDNDALVFFASVDKKEDGLYMSTSRALGVVGIADSVEQAEQISENACTQVEGKVFHRKDVGTAALIQKRVDHMNSLLQ